MGGGGDTASSRHSAHAAQGKMRMRKGFVEKPDTIVQLPDGRTMTLWVQTLRGMQQFCHAVCLQFAPGSVLKGYGCDQTCINLFSIGQTMLHVATMGHVICAGTYQT